MTPTATFLQDGNFIRACYIVAFALFIYGLVRLRQRGEASPHPVPIVLPPVVPAATTSLPAVAAPQRVVTDPGFVNPGPLDNPQTPGRSFDADMAPFRS